MDLLRKIVDILASLRTAIWLLLALLCILLYGSFLMPLREEFQGLHMVPLFRWLEESPAGVTWWLWAAMGILSLLTANTLFCSVESIIKKRGTRNMLLVLSPQVIHIGFLFVLLGHLLSSYGSFKGTAYVSRGTVLQLPNNESVVFDEIHADAGPSGYITDWSADIRYLREGGLFKADVIGPNSPSFRDGFGLYIKTVDFRPFPVALVELSRDPGAIWALVGGVFFLIGITSLLALKIKRERPSG
jgi:hypothetical protein